MPAPSYHRRYWSPEHSPRPATRRAEEYLTEIRDYLRSVARQADRRSAATTSSSTRRTTARSATPTPVAAMRAEGRDPDAELDVRRRARQLAVRRAAGVTSALHVCRGNGPAARGTRRAATARSPRGCSRKLAVDRLLLEYDSDRAGGFEPLADARPGTVVVLGLLTTKSPHLEYEADVLARIDEAARYKPLAELALSTQCGFASVPGRQPGHPRRAAGQARTGGPARPPGLARPARRGRGVVTSSPGGRPRRRR